MSGSSHRAQLSFEDQHWGWISRISNMEAFHRKGIPLPATANQVHSALLHSAWISEESHVHTDCIPWNLDLEEWHPTDAH